MNCLLPSSLLILIVFFATPLQGAVTILHPIQADATEEWVDLALLDNTANILSFAITNSESQSLVLLRAGLAYRDEALRLFVSTTGQNLENVQLFKSSGDDNSILLLTLGKLDESIYTPTGGETRYSYIGSEPISRNALEQLRGQDLRIEALSVEVTSIPEPTATLLSIIGTLALIRRRR